MPYFPPEPPVVDVDIEVLPLGVKAAQGARGYVFRKWEDLIPSNFDEGMLEEVSKLYWQKKAYVPTTRQQYIDFRELEHVYEMF
jgi:hypothetical protein